MRSAIFGSINISFIRFHYEFVYLFISFKKVAPKIFKDIYFQPSKGVLMSLNVEKTLKKIEDFYGEVPFILKEISKDEKDFITSVQKLFHLMGSNKIFSQKETELFAIAGAVGNDSNHCLTFHLRQALKFGATEEEIFQVILIAALMSESSALAMGLRKLKEIENER